MKARDFAPLLVFALAAALLSGCASALTRQASPESWPVVQGYATTNDTETVAVIRAAQVLNRQLNPTPTAPLVDALLGAGIAIASAVGGFLTRHAQQKHVDAAWDEALQIPPPPKKSD